MLVAVAAASRETYPQGTDSREDPGKLMGDREAFVTFLGDRLAEVLKEEPSRRAVIEVVHDGKTVDLQTVIYKFYRCALVHDGRLDWNFHFVPPVGNKLGMRIEGGKFAIDHGWIYILNAVVMGAPCYADEKQVLVPLEGIDEQQFDKEASAQWAISWGRVQAMKDIAATLTPEVVRESDDARLRKRFAELVRTKAVTGGTITGLATGGLTDSNGVLLPRGIALLRHIAGAFRMLS
jgi:hypothetical protein